MTRRPRRPLPPRVVKIGGYTDYDVYIGRGSPWGNPFREGIDGTREEVIARYETRLMTQPELLAQLPSLRGKRLGCYCAPKPCHGDVLLRLANAPAAAPTTAP
jgi:hypothetical protein